MILTRITAGYICAAVLAASLPQHTYAQDNVNAACLAQVYNEMAHEERVYRSVLFGHKPAASLPAGSVMFDKEFDTWIKMNTNQWRSLNEGNTNLTWSDMLMDEQSDVPRRRGIFETKTASTSELIPPLLQSIRALNCRLRTICKAASQSQSALADASDLTLQIDGCKEITRPVMTACQTEQIADLSGGACATVVEEIMEREMQLLQMVVAYDAAYRTLAQFAGIFEGFLSDFRFPLLQPLWQMVRALGTLDGIPCFTGQCDE